MSRILPCPSFQGRFPRFRRETEPGIQSLCRFLGFGIKTLDSGFRRNDEVGSLLHLVKP